MKDIIRQPTLSGRKRITGRQILTKAKACIMDCKIFLAYWTDFTKNGGFPSGTDALAFCIESVVTEHQQNLEKEDDSSDSDDDSDDEDDPPVSQWKAKTQPLRVNRSIIESDGEDAEDEGDDDEESIEYVSKRIHIPPKEWQLMYQ